MYTTGDTRYHPGMSDTTPAHKPETPAETVARLEAIKPECLTQAEASALNRARNAVRQAKGAKGGSASTGGAGSVSRTREYTPADRAKMGERVLAQLDAALDDLGNADPKDRASILSLAAKLSGLLASERTEDVPFVFRGWTRAPLPVLPQGVTAPCPACGQALPTVPPEAAVIG